MRQWGRALENGHWLLEKRGKWGNGEMGSG